MHFPLTSSNKLFVILSIVEEQTCAIEWHKWSPLLTIQYIAMSCVMCPCWIDISSLPSLETHHPYVRTILSGCWQLNLFSSCPAQQIRLLPYPLLKSKRNYGTVWYRRSHLMSVEYILQYSVYLLNDHPKHTVPASEPFWGEADGWIYSHINAINAHHGIGIFLVYSVFTNMPWKSRGICTCTVARATSVMEAASRMRRNAQRSGPVVRTTERRTPGGKMCSHRSREQCSGLREKTLHM